MTISNHIETIRERLRRGEFISEAAVSQGILLLILQELGWPVFDTNVVVPQFSVEGGRVDFALCHPALRPLIFIEVKRVGISEGADRQLFQYAFHSGVPVAVLTDGQEWSFYLPAEQGRYDERRVYKLDLLEREIEEAVSRLERYLHYERVCSGEALESARADYQNVARSREIEATLPRAWKSLLEEPDSLLLELLAEKVEDLCGYRPDLDLCSEFLKSNHHLGVVSAYPIPSHQQTAMRRAPKNRKQTSRSRTTGSFSFVFEGKTYEAASAKEFMVKVFQFLAEADPGFLDRFASEKHGRIRRYIARDKQKLYPNKPHLVEGDSIEIVPGWWLGTNYGWERIKKILDLARKVVMGTNYSCRSIEEILDLAREFVQQKIDANIE